MSIGVDAARDSHAKPPSSASLASRTATSASTSRPLPTRARAPTSTPPPALFKTKFSSHEYSLSSLGARRARPRSQRLGEQRPSRARRRPHGHRRRARRRRRSRRRRRRSIARAEPRHAPRRRALSEIVAASRLRAVVPRQHVRRPPSVRASVRPFARARSPETHGAFRLADDVEIARFDSPTRAIAATRSRAWMMGRGA